jgi:hypothetical protein
MTHTGDSALLISEHGRRPSPQRWSGWWMLWDAEQVSLRVGDRRPLDMSELVQDDPSAGRAELNEALDL